MTNEIIHKDIHKKLAIFYFNKVWDLLDQAEKSPFEMDSMIHMAHTSRFYWGLVGTPVNLSRGEWQISRVYATLNRYEPALFHAKRNLEICLENNIVDFDLAFAYEALARAYSISGNEEEMLKNKQLALKASQAIEKEEDRKLLLSDLDTISLKKELQSL
nr:hypothetical protein [Heyndrickxia oleronia]